MAPANTKERRRRKRLDIMLPISIKYDKSENVLASTKNISVLGTYLEIERKIPTGTDLTIEIEISKPKLPRVRQKQKIRCMGIAFRCQLLPAAQANQQYGIGIFFRSFIEKDERLLANYIDYMLQEEEKLGKIYMRKKRFSQAKRKGGKR